MAPVNMNTMEHFTHPGHQLLKLQSGSTEFLCDGCKTHGTGPMYRCHPCDFDLHECCATSPRSLPATFMHPHPLTLVMRSAQPVNERTCDVCAGDIMGLFYRCKGCGFDVHPLCTRFPQQVTHNYHKQHALTLQAAPAGWYCRVCAGPCGAALRYRCAPCNFDIHAQCIVIIPPSPASSARNYATPPPFVPPPAAAAAPPPYGAAGSSSGGPYNPYHFGNQYPNYMNQDPDDVYNYYMNLARSGGAVPPPTETGSGKSIYAVLGKIALGAFSNMAFGADFSS